jgi:hypothetical protein
VELLLARKTFTNISTIGDLSIDGTFECYTLEDMVRPRKVAAITAIPRGRYKVVITYSPRFKVQMPLLENVPGYAGIRIHTGNKASHTEGCLLVGQTKAQDFIGSSRAAYGKLFDKLNAAINGGQTVHITITGGYDRNGVDDRVSTGRR